MTSSLSKATNEYEERWDEDWLKTLVIVVPKDHCFEAFGCPRKEMADYLRALTLLTAQRRCVLSNNPPNARNVPTSLCHTILLCAAADLAIECCRLCS
jgi:hypothetical protein